jgi:hypothetical protein
MHDSIDSKQRFAPIRGMADVSDHRLFGPDGNARFAYGGPDPITCVDEHSAQCAANESGGASYQDELTHIRRPFEMF